MKWIGQHIWDFISRFRSDVYLEDLAESAQDHVVGIDADGKLYKQDAATGDITSVVAGTNCSGGGTSGDVTINVDDAFLINSGDDTTSGILTASAFKVGGTAMGDNYVTMTPSMSDTVSITAATNGALSITTVDDAAAAANITITADGTAEIAGTTVTLDSAGDIELEVGATSNYINTTGVLRGSNIGVVQDGKIPISSTQFLASSYRFHPQYNLAGGGITMASASVNAYTEVIIPNGYTATGCTMYGTDVDNDGAIRCYSGSTTASGTTALAAASTFSGGSVTHDFGANDVDGNGAVTVVIEWNPGDTVDVLFGGYISITKTT